MNQQDHAILEAEYNSAAEDYFEARPFLQSRHSDRVFDAGFERGWKAAQAQQPTTALQEFGVRMGLGKDATEDAILSAIVKLTGINEVGDAPWQDAVTEQVMLTECAPADITDPVAMVKHLIDWHVSNEREATTAQEPAPCPTCESLARSVMLDQTGHDDYYKRMFEAAASSLAKIDQLLGINDDGCGGAEETIEAVRELAEAQATTAQEPTSTDVVQDAYKAIDRFLRQELDDEHYSVMSECLETVYSAAPATTEQEPVLKVHKGEFCCKSTDDDQSFAMWCPVTPDLYGFPDGTVFYTAAPKPTPLTVEDYTALAHRIASRYVHRSDPSNVAYTFLPHTLDDFVRAIEAAITKGEKP